MTGSHCARGGEAPPGTCSILDAQHFGCARRLLKTLIFHHFGLTPDFFCTFFCLNCEFCKYKYNFFPYKHCPKSIPLYQV